MKFEEALAAMREGKKVRCPSMDQDGEYWEICKISIPILNLPDQLTIHRMDKEKDPIRNKFTWGISRWSIMSEDWEIVDE